MQKTDKLIDLNSRRAQPAAGLEYPGSPVPLGSPFYIERPPAETRAIAELEKPGNLIRLKAPRQTGKSSLLNRLIAKAEAHDYRTALIDFQIADSEHFEDLDRFLRWVWAYLCRQLDIPSELSSTDFWDADIGSKLNSTLLLESRVLQASEQPLVLAFNEVNRMFDYLAIAQDFLGLLRHWHERGKLSPVFERLRIIVVHSTDVYVRLDLNQSPFNVGLALDLPPFTLTQTQELAYRHGLSWAAGDHGRQRLQALFELVGGHPNLVRLALYHLARGDYSLPDLLRDAPTLNGIFADHLRYLLLQLEENASLAQMLQSILHASAAPDYDARALYKLESLGLVKHQDTGHQLSCKLYQQFFLDQAHLAVQHTGKDAIDESLSGQNAMDEEVNPPARKSEWRLDLIDERLWHDDEQIPLRPKAFAMLCYLVENPDRLLSKQELLDHIWPDTYVSEALVKDYVQDLRKAFGDDPKTPRFIESVRGRGYRFIGAIGLTGGADKPE